MWIHRIRTGSRKASLKVIRLAVTDEAPTTLYSTIEGAELAITEYRDWRVEVPFGEELANEFLIAKLRESMLRKETGSRAPVRKIEEAECKGKSKG